MAFAVASCADEELVANKVLGQTGDEVQFGLSLQNSRTVYGEETEIDKDGKKVPVYPIYWVDGDKVFVFSPDCLDGRRGAEYKVILPDNGDKAFYAKDLAKTGDFGVQWGEKDNAIFYSLYPSGAYGLSEDGKIAKGIFVNYSQNIIVDGDNIKSDMEDCLLYARADGAKGEVVNLQYDPITTVFRIKLNVPESSADDFTIQSVSITAPDGVNIAGKFGINVADGTFAGFDENKAKTVSAAISDKNTGGFYTLTKGNSLEIPLFLAPVQGLNTEGWVIKVVANNKEYKKTLGAQTVVPRKIHMVTLPDLATKQPVVEEDWDPATWMRYIPRNVYLSEISIPGTWNSLNSDFQNKTSLNDQYNLGVRTFHLDTRWQASRNGTLGNIINPTITGLSVCDGSTSYSVTGQTGRVNGTAAQTFESCLSTVVKNVKNDEYMIVFCTFAQDSYSGSRCPSTWMQAVSDACNKINTSSDEALKGKIFDGSKLTSNTLVGDVLNHVIVVVNLDKSLDNYTLPSDSKCLFTYVPMNLENTHYNNATADGHIDALYYSTEEAVDVSMYTSHAQISTTSGTAANCGDRGYSHPLTQRDALVESIWNLSKSNYGTTNYKHDKWIYLGLGGYILTGSNANETGYDTIEERYALKLYDRIDAMGKDNVPFYPMGIILMNNKKGSKYSNKEYDFSGVCKKILMLNNKYRLQYDPIKPEDYDPNYVDPEDPDSDGFGNDDEDDPFA